MKVKLDRYEREIEKHADKSVPVSKEERKRIEALIEKSRNERKTRNINIRISEQDLHSLRVRSSKEGIPYQTLIASILHKYLNERLVDEQSVIKAVKLLQGRKK
ncbi:MAG TPA: antitoxin [Spirochaetota bacterium]|nr:antitoxin [Spirochaetota bacterium]HPC41687.1 antitoxin [Spirochaetota bacterium]HPL15663.1 antitoxin [Spirochaetota bacterium]HQF09288.1 antitoxin [Spirochaetota bacterium]HQH98236.1 antitoxin [Spirochaetota bacterium]